MGTIGYSQSLLVSEDSTDYLEPDTTVLFMDDDIELENNLAQSDSNQVVLDSVSNNATVITVDSSGNQSVNDSLLIGQVAVSDSMSTAKADSLIAEEQKYDLLRDTVYWQSVDSLYASYDPFTVDPYGYDGAKFKDTTDIPLCNHGGMREEGDTSSCWSMPMDIHHHITSPFGERRYRWHYGIDFRLTIGDSIRAVFDGVVRISKYNAGGYGYYVLVRHHNGLETIYGHLSKRIAQVGDIVKAGDVIGLGGNTGRSSGPHLHFEVRWKGEAIDPAFVYDFENDRIKSDVFTVDPSKFEYIREMRRKVYHRIRSGDTLSGIAVRYRTTIRTICRLNGISSRTTLRIGRVLRVR